MNVRDKIKETSQDLFLSNGIEGTSTKMICQAAGISNGSLFNQFKTKNDIVLEIYKDNKKETLGYVYDQVVQTSGTRDFFYINFKANVEWRLNNKEKYKFIQMVAKTPLIQSCGDYQDPEQLNFIFDTIKMALDKKEVVGYDLNSLLIINTYFVDGINEYLSLYPETDQNEYIEYTFNQFWRAIVNF